TAVLCGDVADQLLDEHSFSHARASEETDLTALRVRRQKVDDLDPRLQDLYYRTLLLECRRLSVDDPFLRIVDILSIINGLAEHIEQPPQRPAPDRNFDAGTCRSNLHIPVKPLAGREHQTAHLII